MALEEPFEKAAEGQATDESPQDHQNVGMHQAGLCFFGAELNGLAPGTPVGFPGVRCPYLHSMFRFGSRFRKVVSIPGVTEYYNQLTSAAAGISPSLDIQLVLELPVGQWLSGPGLFPLDEAVGLVAVDGDVVGWVVLLYFL